MSWKLLAVQALAAQGLRIVFASHKALGEDIDDSQSLARGLAQHSQIRFLVVATGKSELAISQQSLHHIGMASPIQLAQWTFV